VLVPWNEGRDASIVVIDRATTGADRPMYLRFRTPGRLVLERATAKGKVGGSSFAVKRVYSSGGSPEVRHLDASDCFKEGTVRGRCDAARFAIDEYRTEIPGPTPAAVHVLDIGSEGDARASGDSPRVITLAARGGDPARVIVTTDDAGDTMSYSIAKPGASGSEHVILDSPAAADGTVGVTVAADGADCKITLSASGGELRVATGPASIFVDGACAAKDAAPRKAGAAPRITSHPGAPSTPRRGGGCCSGSATPGSSITMAFVVGILLARKRVPRAPTA